MASSLFPQSQPNNMLGMLQQFNQFKQQMAGQNPEAIVRGLLSSGRMSQQQYQQLSRTAQQLRSILK